MGLKSDKWIREKSEEGMITPFESTQIRRDFNTNEPIISYGISSYGYDMRLKNEWKIFTNVWNSIVDPKNFQPTCFEDWVGDMCVIPPNSFVLGGTVEYFKIPNDVLAVCLGKSTYARCGCVVNITPLEPGWEGHVTVEISNTTPLPVKIYAWEGIAQVLFFQGDEVCGTSYADRNGKYQNQPGIVLPIV